LPERAEAFFFSSLTHILSKGMFFYGFTPAQVRAAYGINSIMLGSIVGDGTGQTIAIVDAYDNPALLESTDANYENSDLHKFCEAFGLADPPSFQKVNQYGGDRLPGAGTTGGWIVEEALDVEWLHAIAPGANIILVEADGPDLESMWTAINTARNFPGVTVVSMSFGINEFSSETDCDSSFATPEGHEGVTFVASTGDWGSPGMYPAYSTNVLAVGGSARATGAFTVVAPTIKRPYVLSNMRGGAAQLSYAAVDALFRSPWDSTSDDDS
jgi:subtilase family serine protease